MDKITRIHLAKIPYEIGHTAQANLKKYLDEIRAELDPDLAEDIMTDIEVRITEILQERKIQRNDVITAKDIDAVQEQLGSPEQFNDGEAKSNKKTTDPRETRRLFRDPDDMYLGGVAGGLGAYFGIDSTLIRIIFIALTFVSGVGVLVYVLLWLLIPVAKTNSDKLMMRGEPVTAANLQNFRSGVQRTMVNLKLRSAFNIALKVLRILFTIGVALFILGLLVSIGFGSALLYTPPLHQLYTAYHLNYALFGLIWLGTMTVIGLLIVLLLSLWRHRSLSVKVASIALASLLLVTLAGTAVVTPFIADHYKSLYGDNKLALALPVQNDANEAAPTSLTLKADRNLTVSYVVSSDPIHATYLAYPGMGQPQVSITSKGGELTVDASQLDKVVPDCLLDWCKQAYLPVQVTLYGPAMQKYSVENGGELDIRGISQNDLTLAAKNSSVIYVHDSFVGNITILADSSAFIYASNASAQIANITAQNNGHVFGPATNVVNATLPLNCNETLLALSQQPTTATLNGKSIPPGALVQNNCVSLDVAPPIFNTYMKASHRVMLPAPPDPRPQR